MHNTDKTKKKFFLLSVQRIRHLRKQSFSVYKKRCGKRPEGKEKTALILFLNIVLFINLASYFIVLCIGTAVVANSILAIGLSFKSILILGLIETIGYLSVLSIKDELTGEWSEKI